MSDQIKIKVSELIGNQICISADDGQKVYNKSQFQNASTPE